MPRWSPNGRERLVDAAMELFRERGYEAVTVNDIAERAGLTRRSYFRHFPDKREVLFPDTSRHMAAITEAVAEQRLDAAARVAVMAALTQVGRFLLRDAEAQVLRQELIDESPELQERELTKLAQMAAAIRTGLVRRGLDPIEAHTCAVIAVEIFQSAYLRAIRARNPASLDDELNSSLMTVSRFVTASDDGTAIVK